jgi:dihydrolipoamide dehydrogenase
VPGRLLVLGGGVVGAEMAQAWSSLGSSVTVIEAQERLLPREEPFAGDELQRRLSSAASGCAPAFARPRSVATLRTSP